MMNKKGFIAAALLAGLAGLVILAIVYAAFTGPFEAIRDEFNQSLSVREEEVVQHIDNVWGIAFLVAGLSVIVWMILKGIARQSREYYR